MRIIKKISLGIAANALALYAITYLMETVQYEGGWKAFLLGGIIVGMLNIFVKPLLKLITLPFLLLSVGLLLIPINAIILALTEKIISTLEIGNIMFQIEGFTTYIIASIIFGAVNWFLHILIKV
ncbi:phage holin family protein [Candidatus Peregrinibacteria bacterium]|nr:phage holin family protein [Candidatus Peregrinibacteria bacterium]